MRLDEAFKFLGIIHFDATVNHPDIASTESDYQQGSVVFRQKIEPKWKARIERTYEPAYLRDLIKLARIITIAIERKNQFFLKSPNCIRILAEIIKHAQCMVGIKG